MTNRPTPPATPRCCECWNKVDLRCLHDEEIEAIEAQGENYICGECLETALGEDACDWRELGTYHVRNGSVVG